MGIVHDEHQPPKKKREKSRTAENLCEIDFEVARGGGEARLAKVDGARGQVSGRPQVHVPALVLGDLPVLQRERRARPGRPAVRNQTQTRETIVTPKVKATDRSGRKRE